MRKTEILSRSETIDLTQAGTIEIANVSGNSSIYVLTDEEQRDVDAIADLLLRNRVMAAMYRLLPGQRRTLQKAKYEIILGADAVAFLAYNGPARMNGAVLN